jgi:hypothetical protein
MSRFSERSVFVLILLGILVFGIGTGAGAAGFVVTKTMWNSMANKVNSRVTTAAVNSKVATLNKRIDDLTGQVATLQAAGPGTGTDDGDAQAALDSHVNELIAGNATVKQAAQNGEEAAAKWASVDASALAKIKYSADEVDGVKGPNLLFDGVNVFIRNGRSETRDNGIANGLGNLIMGYPGKYRGPGTGEKDAEGWPARGGSHYVVVGVGGSWTSAYGLIGGMDNAIKGGASSILGGRWNVVSGSQNAILGGAQNDIKAGAVNCIAGGWANQVLGSSLNGNSIAGGVSNRVSGFGNSVLGGEGNFAWADRAGVTVGGHDNGVGPNPNNGADSGSWSVVGGGTGVRYTVVGGVTP